MICPLVFFRRPCEILFSKMRMKAFANAEKKNCPEVSETIQKLLQICFFVEIEFYSKPVSCF
jgi:hypothetical protein